MPRVAPDITNFGQGDLVLSETFVANPEFTTRITVPYQDSAAKDGIDRFAIDIKFTPDKNGPRTYFDFEKDLKRFTLTFYNLAWGSGMTSPVTPQKITINGDSYALYISVNPIGGILANITASLYREIKR